MGEISPLRSKLPIAETREANGWRRLARYHWELIASRRETGILIPSDFNIFPQHGILLLNGAETGAPLFNRGWLPHLSVPGCRVVSELGFREG
jgi:hypothetical protein